MLSNVRQRVPIAATDRLASMPVSFAAVPPSFGAR
jgi:hypothetical protein